MRVPNKPFKAMTKSFETLQEAENFLIRELEQDCGELITKNTETVGFYYKENGKLVKE